MVLISKLAPEYTKGKIELFEPGITSENIDYVSSHQDVNFNQTGTVKFMDENYMYITIENNTYKVNKFDDFRKLYTFFNTNTQLDATNYMVKPYNINKNSDRYQEKIEASLYVHKDSIKSIKRHKDTTKLYIQFKDSKNSIRLAESSKNLLLEIMQKNPEIEW